MKDAKIPCVIDIYQDSILPARIYIDMKDVLAKLMGDEYEGLEVDEYYVEITYNEYDKADEIKVPKKAKEAADAGGGLDWDSGDDDNDKAKTAPARQSKELGDKWDSYTVQIGEEVVTLPCSISDLEAAGLALDTEDTPGDTAVEADDYVLAYFVDKNGNEVMVDLINTSGEAKKAEECLVGGIAVGTAKDDVLAKYGETEDTYEGDLLHMFTWSDESSYFSQCEIDIDPETNNVCQMSMTKYE